ncbi:MAG: 8-oxo-dGTP diphosphatase [Paracoccaceae bacterium]|jgi:8-oxo-dGTP diphosphatase
MIRRFDDARVSGVRYTNRPGAYGILQRGRDVLVTFQSLPIPEYQLPGGGIDPGETPVRALHREVFEETGWGIRISRRLGAFQLYTYMPEYDLWARKVAQIYLCHPTRVLGPVPEPNHVAHWLPMDEAVNLLGNGGDRHFMHHLFHQLNQNRG